MKELIEKILAYLPEYLQSLGRLLVQPKTFLADIQPDAESGFQNALLFLSVSIVLVVIAVAPTAPNGSDIWMRVASTFVTEFLAVAAGACVLRLAWRIVGGRVHIRPFFVLYAYMSSVVLLLIGVTSLIADGIAKVFDPTLYAAIRQAQISHQPIPSAAGSWAIFAAFLVLLLGFLVSCVWGFATWGAFRAINGATRVQSFMALTLAGLMSWPLAAVMFFIGRAMST